MHSSLTPQLFIVSKFCTVPVVAEIERYLMASVYFITATLQGQLVIGCSFKTDVGKYALTGHRNPLLLQTSTNGRNNNIIKTARWEIMGWANVI